MEEKKFEEIVASNIVKYRKAHGWSQLELAEKLNYSDKAISKWERSECLPDFFTITKLAELFGVNVNELTKEQKAKQTFVLLRKNVIPYLSVGLVWLIATMVFVGLKLGNITSFKPWLVFIFAVPCSSIVLIVFYKMWGKKILLFVSITTLIWTSALSLHLSINYHLMYFVYFIGIPLQILVCLWFFMKKK